MTKDEILEDMLFNIQSLAYIDKKLATNGRYTMDYPLKYSYLCKHDVVEFYNMALEYKIANDRKINQMYKIIRGKKWNILMGLE